MDFRFGAPVEIEPADPFSYSKARSWCLNSKRFPSKSSKLELKQAPAVGVIDRCLLRDIAASAESIDWDAV